MADNIRSKEIHGTLLPVKLCSAGLAGTFADLVTFPLDTAKVRLQLQGEGILASPQHIQKYRGTFGTIGMIAREEGFRHLYSGLAAGLQRQVCFCTIRIGLYDEFKHRFHRLVGCGPDANMPVRLLAGFTSGALSVLVAQPTDVVKVRMQGQGNSTTKRYSGTLQAYHSISRHEGVLGLWKGALPNMARNSITNASELVAYDLLKETMLKRHWMTDSFPCHVVCGFGAGLCATIFASPVDVVKTRYMNSPKGQYSGAFNCALTMAHQNGLRAFYKGCIPSFFRLSSWNTLMFVVFEQLKRLFSGEYKFRFATSLPLPATGP